MNLVPGVLVYRLDLKHDQRRRPHHSRYQRNEGARMGFTARAMIDARYSLTSTYLHAAAMFAKRACEIEATTSSQTLTADILDEHQGHVLAAVMQAVAALEAEIYEVIVHGPGHHLGSTRIDTAARDLLKGMLIGSNKRAQFPKGSHLGKNESKTLFFYSLVLKLLNKPSLNAVQQGSAAALLFDLRDELTHYKSQWGADIDKDFLAKLDALNLRRPSFIQPTENRFPRRYLSAAYAAWAVETAMDVLVAFYLLLDHPPPIVHVIPKVRALLDACK